MRSVFLAVSAAASFFVAIGIAQAAHQDASLRAARHPHVLPAISSGDGAAYYIVQLKDAPAATYAGGVPGYAATSPRYRGGRTLDLDASATYAAYLQERQSSLLESASGLLGHELAVRFRYRYALNGISVKLTPAEAERLAALPGVVSVSPVHYFAPTTSVGMPAAAGDTNASRAWINAPVVWQLPTNGTDNEGEGIVFADLDTGINHANASFAETGGLDGYTAHDPGSLRFGVCDNSNASQHPLKPSFFTCNKKLIGAYTYTQSAGHDPNSPEDSEGHGSHTASTVVGDFVSVTLHGSATPVSGVAPHASLIAYDVCDPTNLCGEDGSAAAVEQAIKDQATLKAAWGSSFKGMVLNFSIGGGDDAYNDTVEQAFLSAVEAGIYVSASGGNGGPSNAVAGTDQYQVEHTGPWVATNAAATHDGSFTSNDLENFTGGDAGTQPGSSMHGAGFTAGFASHPLVYTGDGSFDNKDPVKAGKAPTSGEDYPDTQGASENARQCLYPFNSATFTSSEIVVCDRGTIPLVDKAYNVKQGGAHGMVIATTGSSSQDLPVESYVIPATLLALTDGDALRAWISASSGSATQPQADISGATLTTDPAGADEIAGFSSRAPVGNRYDDVVKPDLTGPGVSVLAAVADPGYADGCGSCTSTQPESYDFFDGTSMASPHDAGSAALLMQAHPSWTPAEIKSALMLTSVTAGLTDQCKSLDSGANCVAGSTLPSPHVRGAGRVDVDTADRTGLVMDETGTHFEAARGGGLTTLNLASLANRACGASCSWTRTVTSAFGSATVHYSVGTSDLSSGLLVSVSPTSFTLAPGQSRKLTITADSGGVVTNKWAFGQVDITTGDTGDGGAAIPAMHMPLAVKAVVPTAHMSLNQSELDFSVAPHASTGDKFSISNDGQLPLDWALKLGKDCAGGGMTGVSVSADHGTIAPGLSGAVIVTFKAGNLAAGTYNGVVCVTSNASDNPKVVLPVQAKVTGATATGSSGGGGGDESLWTLVALILLLGRRAKRD
jgi:subtilisin family serine protease